MVMLGVNGTVFSQTTITTAGTNYTGQNTFGAVPSAVTFVIQNTNTYAITLTKVESFFDPAVIGSTTTTPTLWYSTTSLSGAPTIGAPAWTSIATGPAIALGAPGFYTALDGLSFSIPAGATYRFALQGSGGLSYSGTAATIPTPNTFTADGVILKVGNATEAGLNVGYAGAFPGPTFNPRFFTGKITFNGLCIPNNATAPIIGGAASTCAGQPITLNVVGGSLNGAASWRWYTASCGGTLVGTGNSITVTPGATTTYYVRGEGGCAPAAGPCATKTVTVTNCTCVSPESATICQGAIQRLSVSGAGVPGTATLSSGPISVAVPDASAAGATSTLVAALPAGASITSMTVTFSMTHTWDSDMRFNLVAPNGQILNLVNARGGSGDNFVNTTITSVAGAPSLATGAAPFTGTFAPDAAIGQGPTGFVSNAANFAALFTQTNGNWILAMRDVAGGDLGTLTSWSITFNYSVLPTATWSGGTLFTNAAATTPYIAGSQANAVYVQPSATTTYTATIASGPCAGPNNITVTVLPNPVVTISPASGCGPIALTASGADSYSWSPTTGLSAGSGATVTANPAATTTYTVTGTTNNSCQSTATATVNSAPTASVIAPVAGFTYQIQESFNGTIPPTGWSMQNNSSAPLGATTWFQGNPAVFPAFNGATNSYAASNFQATAGTAGTETISTWLITPVVNLQNGDQVIFYTRATAPNTFPDRLQVRMSTAGTSTNVGTTNTSVGDFTNLLLEINAAQTTTGYPGTWTRFTATVSGLTSPTTGRIAFRYFVTNAGPNGANSDYIGIDQVEYARPAAVNCPNVVTNIAVNITGGVGPYTVVFSNGTTNTTINGYVSGSNIQVSPATTTTYTIVSVTGANGCVGTNNSGTALITITPPASVTTPPASSSVCSGNNATFTVASAPLVGNTFQWQISTDNGATYTNLTNTAPYSGVTTATLNVAGVTTAMTGYRYRVVIQGACGGPTTSAAATLTVNTPAVITASPQAASVCANGSLTNGSTTFSVNATGGGLTYQWQVGTGSPLTWANITNGGSYNGANTSTLTVSSAATSMSGNFYRVLVSSGGCTATVSDSAALTVKPVPVVVISANPFTSLFPGLSTTLTAAVNPSTPASTITWFKNGVAVTGTTGNTLLVDVDDLGLYSASATTTGDGCSSMSVNTINIKDSANSLLFIYPSPNSGQFQVRYYSAAGNAVPRFLTVYDSKGSRVFFREYTIAGPYTSMDVDMSNYSTGVYMVELGDRNGKRIKTGRVVIR